MREICLGKYKVRVIILSQKKLVNKTQVIEERRTKYNKKIIELKMKTKEGVIKDPI